MDRRHDDRFCQRMACQLELNGRRHHGLVLNVSSRGLFIQTRVKAPKAPNVVVSFEMRPPGADEVMTLQAVVARQYWVPDQLLNVAKGGMGLVIRGVYDAWSELLADLEAKKMVSVGGEPMAPLRLQIRASCLHCGRRGAGLWSGVCGWCNGEP